MAASIAKILGQAFDPILSAVDTAAKAVEKDKTSTSKAKKTYTLNKALSSAYNDVAAAQEAYNNLGTDTTYSDMAKAYEERARASLAQQEAALLNQLNASKGSTARNYESSASQNYINYMKQRGALPEQLAALGINGGASETALTRVMNNYALGQGANSASRNAAISSLQGAYDTNVANLRRATEDNIAANALEMQQKQAQFDYQRQIDAYNRLQDAYARASTLDQQKYERDQATRENNANTFQNRLLRFDSTEAGLKSLQKYKDNYKKNHKNDKSYKQKMGLIDARINEIRNIIYERKHA